MRKYNYEPLNLDRPAIRLLHLHKGDNNSKISCSLFQVEMNERNDAISYEALSYTWGFADTFEEIIVDGCYLNVTYNLHLALQQLRYSDVDRMLWIDAICIDQGNKDERGHQVERMSKIYSEAQRVIFWLGQRSDETDILMESLQRLQSESNKEPRDWSLQDDRWKSLWASMEPKLEKSREKVRTSQCQGLRELLARPWFRRVWILQEVALAKAGVIICGGKEVSARVFGLAPLLLGIKPDSHCQSVLDIMPSPWRKTSWWSKSPNLRMLLLSFGDSEATESHDLVYALRGMSSDAAEKNGIIPDYDKSEEDLVREVVRVVEHCELEKLALQIPPRSVRDLIKCLRDLDLSRCMALARKSSPQDLEMHLKKFNVRINQDIFMTAVKFDNTGEVVEILLRYHREEFVPSHTFLLAAAENPNGAKGIFEALFRYKRELLYISHEVLMAAARNEICGGGIFEALFRYQGNKITISDEVLITAAENQQCGNVMFEALLRCQGDQIKISDAVLITAASSKFCAGGIFEAIFRYQGDKIKISDEVLITAAGNQQCGNAIFEALFRYQGSQFEISDEALEAATRGIPHGDAMSPTLTFPEYSTFLRRDRLEYTSMGLLRVAAANKGCGDRAINTFLSHHPKLANFSEEVVIAAAKNKGCGDKILNTILSHQSSSAIISQEAVIAAANNKGCDHNVMDTLVSYRPDLSTSQDLYRRFSRKREGAFLTYKKEGV